MHQSPCFTRTLFPKSPFCKGCYSLILLTSLLLFWIFFANTSVHGARSTKFGCISNIPPTVSETPIVATETSNLVWINEVLSNPGKNSLWNCAAASGGEVNAWVEIYNPQSYALDLYAARADISIDGGTNWYRLLFGSVVASKGFLTIFPSATAGNASNSLAWDVILRINNTFIDQVQTPALAPDQSYARIPDGSTWQIVADPTINTSNNNAASLASPTPTAKSTPAPTPKPVPTSKDTGAGKGSGASTPNTLGTQPVWNQIQLPPDTTTTPENTTSTQTPAQVQNSNVAADHNAYGGQIALMIALGLLFLSTLIWCWRLFRAP